METLAKLDLQETLGRQDFLVLQVATEELV